MATLRELQNLKKVADALRVPNEKGELVLGTMHIEEFEKFAKDYVWNNLDVEGGGGSGIGFNGY